MRRRGSGQQGPEHSIQHRAAASAGHDAAARQREEAVGEKVGERGRVRDETEGGEAGQRDALDGAQTQQDLFLGGLDGLTDPEAKRKFIGKTFIDVFEDEANTVSYTHPEPTRP